MNPAESPFSPQQAAKRVLRLAATGALATLSAGGAPFASLVIVATNPAGAPLLLLSQLAVHTRNLAGDARASLLLVAPGGEAGDPLAGARVTISGEIVADRAPATRQRFLARHQEAALYADFKDFGFYRLDIASAHLVAGFGRIVDLRPADLLTDISDCADLLAAEESAIAHMNEDHAEALHLYATRLCALPAGDWTATGIDPDGIDLRAGAMRARVDFPEKVRTGTELRKTLAALAKEGRDAESK